MARALLILGVGILLTFVAVMLLTPGAFVAARGFAAVLVTIMAGTAVMAVVAWRARIRERAEQLEDRTMDDDHVMDDTDDLARSGDRATDEHTRDTDRG